MLNVKYVIENIELVKKAIKNKNAKANIDNLEKMYEDIKKKKFKFDNSKANQNKVSKEIGVLKKNKQDASETIKEMRKIGKYNKQLASEISEMEEKLSKILLTIPNIPNESVPVGLSDEDNEFVRKWSDKKKYDFKPKDHIEIMESKGMIDMKRAAKISGSGFSILTGKGAKLERALINFMLDQHIDLNGYCEMNLPFIVNRESMTGTGQLPKLEDDMYFVEEDDLFLIPTGEVPATNFHAKEIIHLEDLPIKTVAYTSCFRREAGSYGKDTKGLKRLHQFNKVELVQFVEPEKSEKALLEIVSHAEKILQDLGLHYKVVKLCTGDLSFASSLTYDLEVWSPGVNEYLEVSSISNFLDFQARRADIRYRMDNRKLNFVHTLNGSGLALPRLIIAIVENYQNEDGSISVPEKLIPYMNNLKTI